MNTLKLRKLALIVGSLLFALVVTPAVQARGGNPEQRLEKMTEHLELSSDQVDKIRVILDNAKTQADALRDQDGDREAKHEALRAIREDSREQIKAVLNAEQLSKFEAMADRQREKRGERGERKGQRGNREN